MRSGLRIVRMRALAQPNDQEVPGAQGEPESEDQSSDRGTDPSRARDEKGESARMAGVRENILKDCGGTGDPGSAADDDNPVSDEVSH
jgi:hypothetical protein